MIEEVRLPNGIRVIHEENPFSDIAHLGVFIHVGTRDEEANEFGLAHFLEHVIFKGTKKRKSRHVLSRLDAVGGEINAYTTKEDTCLYASFTDNHLKRASELLADITFNSTFPKGELKKEKEVVIDEINSYKDAPSELIFDEFDNLVFGNHALGRDILGNKKSVRGFKRSDVVNFVSDHYTPDRMVISSVGNYSMKTLQKILSKYFGEFEMKGKVLNRTKPVLGKVVSETNLKEIHQAHCMLGNQAYSSNDKNRSAFLMLNNLLGGPAMNSRLNLQIREKHGLTYNIESNYTPYSDSGIFSIYYGTDIKNIEKTESLIKKELEKLCEKKLGTNELHKVKQQIVGQIAMSMESKVGVMLSLGKSKILHDTVDPIEEVLNKFNIIKAKELREVANQIIHPNNLFSLTYKPK
jgi:predicted Zn-dependent peptidase